VEVVTVLVEQVLQRGLPVDPVDLEVVEQEKVQEQVVLVVQEFLVKVIPEELDMEVHQVVVEEVVELPLPEEMLIQVVETEVQEHQMLF
tara:strand:- start:106 stop:372 length:267 start_codon:yes stop_codon:yes gene_type:complete